MKVDNWRSHILVKCKTCNKLMGHHVETKDSYCVECYIKQVEKQRIK
jgi:hypothetical protein